jgi:hypothetical protein
MALGTTCVRRHGLTRLRAEQSGDAAVRLGIVAPRLVQVNISGLILFSEALRAPPRALRQAA